VWSKSNQNGGEINERRSLYLQLSGCQRRYQTGQNMQTGGNYQVMEQKVKPYMREDLCVNRYRQSVYKIPQMYHYIWQIENRFANTQICCDKSVGISSSRWPLTNTLSFIPRLLYIYFLSVCIFVFADPFIYQQNNFLGLTISYRIAETCFASDEMTLLEDYWTRAVASSSLRSFSQLTETTNGNMNYVIQLFSPCPSDRYSAVEQPGPH